MLRTLKTVKSGTLLWISQPDEAEKQRRSVGLNHGPFDRENAALPTEPLPQCVSSLVTKLGVVDHSVLRELLHLPGRCWSGGYHVGPDRNKLLTTSFEIKSSQPSHSKGAHKGGGGSGPCPPYEVKSRKDKIKNK